MHSVSNYCNEFIMKGLISHSVHKLLLLLLLLTLFDERLRFTGLCLESIFFS